MTLRAARPCRSDWVDRSGHASWSTEKAVVTGRQAAGAAARALGLRGVESSVIPAAPDTPQLQALRRLARFVRGAVPRGGETLTDRRLPPPAPWAAVKELLEAGLRRK